MKKDKAETERPDEIKICKKCGNPLSSKSKYKLCEHCRRERAKHLKEVSGTVLAIGVAALSVVPGVKHFVKK